jgi:hypothetical protein
MASRALGIPDKLSPAQRRLLLAAWDDYEKLYDTKQASVRALVEDGLLKPGGALTDLGRAVVLAMMADPVNPEEGLDPRRRIAIVRVVGDDGQSGATYQAVLTFDGHPAAVVGLLWPLVAGVVIWRVFRRAQRNFSDLL